MCRNTTDMILKELIVVTEAFTGKSKFTFWSDIQVQDTLIVRMELTPTGSNRGKIYAPTIQVLNGRTREVFSDSINSIQNRLKKIKYV